jgi:hypothetical protein
MPYGLPGALKLPACKAMLNDRVVLLPEGTVCQPLYPCADQDGWDGHWAVLVPKLGQVRVPGDALPVKK